MIVNELPDPSVNTLVTKEMAGNTIILSRTCNAYHHPKHETPFLLIANQIGQGNYCMNGRQVKIGPKHFYVLNPGDELSIDFQSSLERETLLILFSERLFYEAAYHANSGVQSLLDDPKALKTTEAINFPLVPFKMLNEIAALSSTISSGEVNSADIEQKLINLTSFLFVNMTSVQRCLDEMSAMRQSTKEELFSRVQLAEEYIHDNITRLLTLDEIADQVCLNKFHMTRLFKEIHNITPYQYFQKVRIGKAYELLQNGHSVTDACLMVGFESLGSFSNLFKKIYGYAPSSMSDKLVI
ncbi:AraC family transcriptional regulator [Fulvivirgaceae bacterium PWU4]|uniref:AraC family transcriptional regulator n=1 Tax=Chryseosolibacter histidini TaxID=2782349 RepID=A0AAP2DKI4_9BACT|nr:AraC family transcriptional regulator [Chryseosolibacter histidini]MBT1698030.1 AraC family transcriptional regulator [Chryseosolibacter histidini]